MASERAKNTAGYALLGLGIGVILFSFYYIIVNRAGIAQRYEWSWVLIHLLVLLGPAIVLGLFGSRKTAQSP